MSDAAWQHRHKTEFRKFEKEYEANKRDIKVVKEIRGGFGRKEEKRGRTGGKGIYVSMSGVAGGR